MGKKGAEFDAQILGNILCIERRGERADGFVDLLGDTTHQSMGARAKALYVDTYLGIPRSLLEVESKEHFGNQ